LIDAPAREKLKRVLEDQHLHIGGIIFPELDQVDFTGPFEVFSRLPNTTFHVIAKTPEPIRDVKGLVLTPQMTLDDAPDLDVLCVPGGVGIRNVLEDEQVLEFIQAKADKARYVFSVCTGALVCGAAGLLRGCRATTHWASFHLLPYFGAIPVDHRVVIDQDLITTAGVTAGIDGALRLAALLRGDAAAQQIQLEMEYAPQPPFHSGRPESAPRDVLSAVRADYAKLLEERKAVAERIGRKFGIVHHA